VVAVAAAVGAEHGAVGLRVGEEADVGRVCARPVPSRPTTFFARGRRDTSGLDVTMRNIMLQRLGQPTSVSSFSLPQCPSGRSE
jgi:hypothetical protein